MRTTSGDATSTTAPSVRGLYHLRHCNATHLADQGTPVQIFQRRLGHRSPTTALRYCTHVIPDTERAAADRLADRLLGRASDRRRQNSSMRGGRSSGFAGSSGWRNESFDNWILPQLRDLAAPPGNRLEALKGDREGHHSIRINDQWRICFMWRDGDAYDVEIVDYHSEDVWPSLEGCHRFKIGRASARISWCHSASL